MGIDALNSVMGSGLNKGLGLGDLLQWLCRCSGPVVGGGWGHGLGGRRTGAVATLFGDSRKGTRT